jgi:hypothetical protein
MGFVPHFSAPVGATPATVTTAQNAANAAQSTANAALPKAGGTLTGLVLGAKSSDINSSAPDLSAATGNSVDITGTTTITAFGTVAAGTRMFLRFTGILTITYNGTSMILPGARDIKTEAGDTAIFESLGSGNWVCLAFLRSNGLGLGDVEIININTSPTLTADQLRGQLITLTGAITPKLPVAQIGMNAAMISLDATAKNIDPDDGDHFVLNGTALGAGHKALSASLAGDTLAFICIAANTWEIIPGINVNWTDGG